MLIGACAPAHAPTVVEAESRETLQHRAEGFSAAVVRASESAWAAPEVEALVDFYTEDAVLFPPGADPIRGREAVRAYWTRTADRKILEHAIETERLDVSGDLAADHGTFTIRFQSGAQAPESATLIFISIWRRGPDGQWRKQLDTWW